MNNKKTGFYTSIFSEYNNRYNYKIIKENNCIMFVNGTSWICYNPENEKVYLMDLLPDTEHLNITLQEFYIMLHKENKLNIKKIIENNL